MSSSTNNGRRRARKVIDNTIPSPCIGVCALVPGELLCGGCLRTTDEIRDWIIMDTAEKQSTLQRVEVRRQERGDNAP